MNQDRLSNVVAEIFERWPNTVNLFLQNRMSCPGCYLAKFEQLDGALLIYDIPSQEFLEALEQIIIESETNPDGDYFE